MMWASFLVGMELPGKRAVFWRLMLQFFPELEFQQGPFTYDAVVEQFDERYDLLHTTGRLSSGTTTGVTAQTWAFVRQDSPQPSLRRMTELLPPSERLIGRVALVIGGQSWSRRSHYSSAGLTRLLRGHELSSFQPGGWSGFEPASGEFHSHHALARQRGGCELVRDRTTDDPQSVRQTGPADL